MGRKKKVWRGCLLPEVDDRLSYIDTVAFRLPKLMQKAEFRDLRLAMFNAQGTRKRRIVLRKVTLPVDVGGWYFMMYVHQPTPEALELLASRGGPLAEVHVALDLVASTWGVADELKQYLLHRLLRNASPSTWTTWVGSTGYIGQTKWRPQSRFVIYSDRRSKVNHQHCCHVELRVVGQRDLRNHQLLLAKDVLNLQHRAFWDRQLRLQRPPSERDLVAARARFLRKQGRPVERRVLENSSRLYMRMSRAADGAVSSSDLLFALRSSRYVGKTPVRLFYRESHDWMLPEPPNALWTAPLRDGPACAR